MKSIDFKSLLIGTLLASTIFLGVAAQQDHHPPLLWDEPQGHAKMPPPED